MKVPRTFNLWFEGRQGPIAHHIDADRQPAGHLHLDAEGDMDEVDTTVSLHHLSEGVVALAFPKPSTLPCETVLVAVNFIDQTALAFTQYQPAPGRPPQIELLVGTVDRPFTYDVLTAFPQPNDHGSNLTFRTVADPPSFISASIDTLGHVANARIDSEAKPRPVLNGRLRRIGDQTSAVYWATRQHAATVLINEEVGICFALLTQASASDPDAVATFTTQVLTT